MCNAYDGAIRKCCCHFLKHLKKFPNVYYMYGAVCTVLGAVTLCDVVLMHCMRVFSCCILAVFVAWTQNLLWDDCAFYLVQHLLLGVCEGAAEVFPTVLAIWHSIL